MDPAPRQSLAHRRRPDGKPCRPDTGAERSTERGVALVELGIVVTLLTFLVLGAIDLGRLAGFQNRMENAAREGGAVVQLTPAAVDSGCHGDRNVADRVARQNPELASTPGFSVVVERKVTSVGGAVTYVPYTGCETPTTGLIQPGERVRVTVEADVRPSGVITAKVLGDPIHLSRSIEVVVQG